VDALHLEHVHDVRVLDPREEPGLVEEHRDVLLIPDVLRVQDLDDDALLEPARAAADAQVDLRHPPFTDRAYDLVPAYGCRRDRFHGSFPEVRVHGLPYSPHRPALGYTVVSGNRPETRISHRRNRGRGPAGPGGARSRRDRGPDAGDGDGAG